MKTCIMLLWVGCLVNTITVNAQPADPNESVTLTVLYDNYTQGSRLQTAWGFSCLIEGSRQTILFDTGGDPKVLAANCQKLNIDPRSIDIVVISHMHWDHINGLEWLIQENDHFTLFLPDSAPDQTVADLKARVDQVERISANQCLCPAVFSTGTLPHQIPEQALCLETPEGLVIITGCSHPGIVKMIQTAKEISGQKIHLVFGGFHLTNQTTEQIQQIIRDIQSLGVEKIGPTHCTGDKAIAVFRDAWGKNFISMGAGKQIQLPVSGKHCTK